MLLVFSLINHRLNRLQGCWDIIKQYPRYMEQHELNQKREKFYVKIKREKKEEQIRSRRNQFLNLFYEGKFDDLMYPTQEARDQKIIEAGISLKEDPSQAWKDVVNELFNVMRGSNDMELWRVNGIISRLLLAFEEKYSELKITSGAANIINNYLHRGDSKQIEQFMQQVADSQIIKNLSRIAHKGSFTSSKEQFMLIGNIINENGYLRNLFCEQGMPKIIINQYNVASNKGNFSEHQTEFFAWICQGIIKYYPDPQEQLTYSITAPFMNIFIQILSSECGIKIKQDAICGLLNIVYIKKSQIRNIFHFGGIVPIIQYAFQRIHCEWVWSLLNIIVGSQFDLAATQFATKRGISLIEHALEQDLDDKIRKKIIHITGNLVCNSPTDCDNVIKSEILDKIISNCNDSKLTIRNQSLNCLLCVISNIRYAQMQYLSRRYDIFDVTIKNLINTVEAKTKLTCLKIIYQIVLKYVEIYDENKSNEVVNLLISKYNIDEVLTNISQNYQNQEVVKKAESLLELLSDNIKQ